MFPIRSSGQEKGGERRHRADVAQGARGGAVSAAARLRGAGGQEAPVAKGAAYDALMAKAEELGKHDPGLSTAQAFAKAYAANPALAARERAENRPA